MPAASRRLVAIAAALALVAAIPAATNARTEGIKETSRTTYTLLPDEGVVSVKSSITLKNQKKPTTGRGPCESNPKRTCKITTSYYADGWGTILIPPEATDVRISGPGVKPVVIGSDEAGTAFAVQFPRLDYKKKQRIDIAFALPDGGPDSDQSTRVTDAYARFCWNGEFTDSGSTQVVLPTGWTARTTGAQVKTTTDLDGTTIKPRSNKLPGAINACTDAFVPTAMVQSHVLAPGGQVVTVSAWPSDPDWTADATDIITEHLPALEATIGSPMPFASLSIQEVARTNGFGTRSDLGTETPRLLMDEDFDFEAAPLAALARTWFEDGSIGDPWLAEGLSLWAGLSTTGYECPEPGDYPVEGSPNLLDWQVGMNNTSADPMLPVFQISAACSIVEDVAEVIGPARMAEVIDSLRTGRPRYGDRASDPRTPWASADWTDWLDAVDELGLAPAGVTDLGTAERALTQYGIASPETLTGRLSARMLYHETLASMDGTAMPAYVDALMEAWAFSPATSAILEAERVYGIITSHPTLTDEARAAFLDALEATPSADALAALEAAIADWIPATVGE